MTLFVFFYMVLSFVVVGVFGRLSLSDVKDVAAFSGSKKDMVVKCDLTQGGTIVPVRNAGSSFIVKWQFIPLHSAETPKTVLTISGDGATHPRINSLNISKYENPESLYLKINSFDSADVGMYSCIMGNERRVANAYLLRDLSCHNLNATVRATEKAFFDCTVSYQGKQPPILSWEHGNRKLNANTKEYNNTFATTTLVMNTTHENNGNVFMCMIQYPGIFSSYCHSKPLKVFYPAFIEGLNIIPSTIQHKYKTGSQILLKCHARGNPHPTIRWTFTPTDGTKPSHEVSDLAHFTISSATLANSGKYMCTASNRVRGETYSKSKVLEIQVTGKDVQRDEYTVLITNSNQVSQEKNDGKPVQKTYEPEISAYAIGAIATAGLAVLLIIVFVVLAMKFRARDKKLKERFSRAHDEMMDDQEVELLDENIQPRGLEEPVQYSQLKQCWELPRKDIRMSELIARGVYVEVWKGRMKKHPESDQVMRVAIKKLLPETTEKGRKFFLAEMEVAKVLQSHVNIIQLIGCYTLNEPWLIMLEYAQEGTLIQFLHRFRPGAQRVEVKTSNNKSTVRLRNYKVDSHKMLAMAAQVVSGLDHISKFKLICYRLRSASVLVGRGGVCKLSGFGFPQDVTERNLYEADSLPINTLAPEVLKHNNYSTQTDVWAYGVLLWEILHFGASPYPGISSEKISEKVQNGYRMEPPPHCSEEMNELLQSCWEFTPEKRPNYSKLMGELSGLAVEHDTHIMLDQLPVWAGAPDTFSEDSDSI